MVITMRRLSLVSPIDSSMRLSTRRGTRQSRRPAKRICTPLACSSSRRRISSDWLKFMR